MVWPGLPTLPRGTPGCGIHRVGQNLQIGSFLQPRIQAVCPEKIHGTGWWDRESFLEEEASGLSFKDPMIKTCQVKDTRGKGTCRQT